MVQKWLNQGYTTAEIARMWNGGSTEVKKGVNDHGQAYDTELYSHLVLSKL